MPLVTFNSNVPSVESINLEAAMTFKWATPPRYSTTADRIPTTVP